MIYRKKARFNFKLSGKRMNGNVFANKTSRIKLIFKSQQIYSWKNFIANFVRFQLLDSSTFHINYTFQLYKDLFASKK